MSRTKQLAQRRALLVTECALQRITLAGQTHTLSNVTNWINASQNLLGYFKNLPAWVWVFAIGIVVVAPGRALALAKKGVLLFQLWQAVFAKTDA